MGISTSRINMDGVLCILHTAQSKLVREKANIINLLLKKGANMQLNNNDGQKPKDISPQKDQCEPPRKKRRMEHEQTQQRINRDLSEEFELQTDDHNHNRKREEDGDNASEFSEDPYDNYSPPKLRSQGNVNGHKRGRNQLHVPSNT